MFSGRTFIGSSLVAAVIMLFSSSSVFADHLDRLETRRIVRQLEERNDALQDRIDTWIGEHHEDREHRADALTHAAQTFDQSISQFKLDLYNHDEPWELRDNAQRVITAAAEFNRTVDREEWHGIFRHEAEEMRQTANELARHYHLPEAGK